MRRTEKSRQSYSRRVDYEKEYYVQGNLVSEASYLPERYEENFFQPEVIEGTKKTVAIKVNKGYTILLFLSIVLFIGICAIYLKSAFSLIAVQAEVDRLKANLQTIRTQNDLLEQQINKTVNLEKTYEFAVNELKMRLPQKHEIHYITRKAGSYTVKLNQQTYSEQNNNLKQFILFILKDW